MKNLFAFLFIGILYFSKTAQAQSPVIIDIEWGIENQQKLNISELVDDIQYIPLETNNNNLISYIKSIKFVDELILVATFNPSSLFSFDSSGKFLNKIGNQGRGPNEYNFFGNFGIKETNKEVYLYGLEPSKLLVYNNNGTLKENLEWPNSRSDNFHNIEFIANDNFVLMQANGGGNTPYSYKIYSTENKLIKEAINPIQYKMNGVTGFVYAFSYFKFNDDLFVKENLYNDTLYRITPSLEFEPKYILNSGKYSCPVQFSQNMMSFFQKNDLKYVRLTHIFDFKEYLTFFFAFEKKEYFGFYNKSLKKTFTYPNKGIINDFDGGVDFYPIYQSNNKLIGYVNALDLITHVASDDFKNSTPKYLEKKKQLEKLANSLNENDNPVLMLVKLKE